MKNKIQHLFLLLFLISCQPDNIENKEQPAELPTESAVDNVETDEYFTAKVDGKEFVALSGEKIHGSFSHLNNMQYWSLSLYGVDGEGNFIEFYIVDYKGPGIYITGMDGIDDYMMYVDGKTKIYWQSGETTDPQPEGLLDEGVLEITKEDDKILEGTFQFTGYTRSSEPQKKVITEGTFRTYASRF